MDLLGLVDLVLLGSVSKGLHEALEAPTRQLAMEHCRVVSARANRSEGHRQDLMGMMVEVASQRDAAEDARDAAEDARALAETARDAAEDARALAETARDAAEDARALAEDHRDAAEQARDDAEEERDAARGRIRELELELADAKRARR